VYTNAQQVVDCVASMLGVDPKACSAELKMVIGWNGTDLISSTDWHITYPGGCCILPPCISPQYPTFAGLHVTQYVSNFMLLREDDVKPVKVSFLNSYEQVIYNKELDSYNQVIFNKKFEPIAITFREGDRIILSDCEVICERRKDHWNYNVLNYEDTIYGKFINGNLCLER